MFSPFPDPSLFETEACVCKAILSVACPDALCREHPRQNKIQWFINEDIAYIRGYK